MLMFHCSSCLKWECQRQVMSAFINPMSCVSCSCELRDTDTLKWSRMLHCVILHLFTECYLFSMQYRKSTAVFSRPYFCSYADVMHSNSCWQRCWGVLAYSGQFTSFSGVRVQRHSSAAVNVAATQPSCCGLWSFMHLPRTSWYVHSRPLYQGDRRKEANIPHAAGF